MLILQNIIQKEGTNHLEFYFDKIVTSQISDLLSVCMNCVKNRLIFMHA